MDRRIGIGMHGGGGGGVSQIDLLASSMTDALWNTLEPEVPVHNQNVFIRILTDRFSITLNQRLGDLYFKGETLSSWT